MITIIFSLLFASFTPAADAVTSLDCTVRVIASEIKDGSGEASLNVPLASGNHGGEERTFKFAPYEVITLVDGKWMGLSWWRGEELIAEALFVLETPYTQARVVIMYDPKNRENQASIDCAPAGEGKTPGLKRWSF